VFKTFINCLKCSKRIFRVPQTLFSLKKTPKKLKYQPGSGTSAFGEPTSSSQEMLISVICCVTGRAAVAALLGDSALAAEEWFRVASMIWMAEASAVGLLVTLLEAAGRDHIL